MLGFFKPKWQHRNPKIRIEAVNNNLDKELILKVAQTDKDIDVRIAAFNQIIELNILYAILLQEPCEAGKNAVLQRIAVIFNQSENIQSVVDNFMQTTVRRDFPLADLLMVSEGQKLKQLLFSKINLQKDLPKLLKCNYVFNIDELLLVKDLDTLSDILKKSSITDKKILSHLKAMIHQEEKQSRNILLKKTLLQRYELLAVSEPLSALNTLSDLEKEWNENDLGNDNQTFKDSYLARYHAYNFARQEQLLILQAVKDNLSINDNLDQSIKILKELLQNNAFSTKEKQEIQLLLQQVEQQLLETKKQDQIVNNVQKKFSKINTSIEKNTETTKDKIVFDQESFEKLSIKLQAFIEDGSLQEAKKINEELLELVKQINNLKEKNHYQRIVKQLAQPLYDQLDTVRWGALQSLEQLCNEAEQLVKKSSSELVSIKLKQLREDWNASRKSLEQVPHKLHQRFELACRQMHQRIVEERNNADKVRATYIEEAQALLKDLALFIQQIDWQKPNWSSLIATRTAFLQEWNRYLNQYSTDGALNYGAPLFLTKDKQKIEKAMRQIIKPLEIAMQNERIKEKKRREDEIIFLQKLLQDNNLKEAVEKVKAFNKNFQPTVRLKHQEENLLWKQLRLINDQIFAVREEFVTAEENEKLENTEQKKILLNELKEIYKGIDNNETSGRSISQALAAIEYKWLEIGVTSKNDYVKLESELKSILKKIIARLDTQAQEKGNQQRQKRLELAYNIGVLENDALNSEEIIINEALYESSDALLRKRLKCLEQIIVGQESAKQFLIQKTENSLQEAHNLVLLREILLNKTSPAEDQSLRLIKQAEILEHAMTNSFGDKEKKQQLKNLDDKWLENVIGIIPDTLCQRFI